MKNLPFILYLSIHSFIHVFIYLYLFVYVYSGELHFLSKTIVKNCFCKTVRKCYVRRQKFVCRPLNGVLLSVQKFD